MGGTKYATLLVAAATASFFLQGCEELQKFVDTHAEAICEHMEEAAVQPIKDEALTKIDGVCAADADPVQCKNCAANGIEQVHDSQKKPFIEECAEATRNIFNDTDAATNFYNHSAPEHIRQMNVSFAEVLANPSQYCNGAGSGATRLFQLLPAAPQSTGNSVAIGALCGVALISSLAGLAIAHRVRRDVHNADMTPLQDEEMVELEE